MSISFFKALSAAAALITGFAATPAWAQESDSAVVVKDYDVFVDVPTAFAFIKLPMGWKFIGRLDAEQLRDLPPGTLTSLLPSDPSDTATPRFASKEPKAPALKRKS